MTTRCWDMFIIWYVVVAHASFFETRTISIPWTVRHFTFTWAITNLFLRVNTETIPSDSLVNSGHLFTFIMAQSSRSNIWTGYISIYAVCKKRNAPMDLMNAWEISAYRITFTITTLWPYLLCSYTVRKPHRSLLVGIGQNCRYPIAHIKQLHTYYN